MRYYHPAPGILGPTLSYFIQEALWRLKRPLSIPAHSRRLVPFFPGPSEWETCSLSPGQPPAPIRLPGVLDTDIRSQVRSCLETIKAILEGAGTSLENVVSVTAYLKDPSLFSGYNEEYMKFFPTDPPARTTVQANLMRPELLVEITSTAVIPS